MALRSSLSRGVAATGGDAVAATIKRALPPKAAAWPLDDGSDSEDDEAAATASRLRAEAEERARPVAHALPTPLTWTTSYHSDDEQDDNAADAEVIADEAPSLHPIVSLDIVDRRITSTRVAGESAAGGSMLMSSSSDNKSHNMLYADSHAPYLYIHRNQPLSVWVVGGPLSGSEELATSLSKRLSVILITLESCISYARDAKLSTCTSILASMDDGTPLKSSDIAILLAAKLSSPDVIFAGYVLTSLACSAADLETFASRSELKGVWPPQYVVDLTIDDKDVYSRAISLRDRVIGMIGPDAELKEALRIEDEEKKKRDDEDNIGRASRQSRRPRSSGATDDTTNGNGNGRRVTKSTSNAVTDDKKKKKKKKKPAHDDEGDDDEEKAGESEEDDDADDDNHSDGQHSDADSHTSDVTAANGGASTNRSSNRRTVLPEHDAHHLIEHDDNDTITKDDGLDAGTNGWCAISMELSLAPLEMLQHELKLYQHDRPNMKRFIQSITSSSRIPGSSTTSSSLSSSVPLLPADATQSPLRLVDLVMHVIGQQRHYSRAVRLDVPLEFKLPTDDSDQPEILMALDLQQKEVIVNETFGVWQHYCPVSLVDKHSLVEGSLEYAASYQGASYLFGSDNDARKFLSNPDRYIRSPPSLPSPYTVALVGAHATGKSSIAHVLKERYGWHVLTKDVDGKELVAQSIIDGAPSNKEQLEELLKRSVTIDRVIMLYVDEVELLADRRRAPDQRRAARAAAAAAATAANLAATLGTPSTTGGNGMIASESKGDIRVDLTHRHTADGKTEHSQEEEDLMDAAYEYQEKLWPVYAQLLDERHIKYSEIDASATLEQVVDGVRAAMDPFYQYRRRNAASILSKEQIDRSARDEDRFDMRSSARLLRYDRTPFCPVCLIDRRLLVPGRDTLNVRVVHQSYSCCSNDCVTKFITSNDSYHIHNAARLTDLSPDMPELKILVIGGRAAGKSSVCQLLSRHIPAIKRVTTLSSLLHQPLVALTQRVLKQASEAEAKRIADRSARDDARRADDEKRERERKERRDKHDTDDDEHSTRAPSAASATSAAGRDDDDDDDTDDRDKDMLINFAKADPAAPQPYEISLRDLMESNWLRDNDIDDIWRAILSHGSDQYPSPSGYIIEVDIQNPALIDRLAAVIATHNESKPHIVVPVEASASVCVTRLLSGDKAVRSKLIRDSKSRPTSATSQDSTMGESEERTIWTDFNNASIKCVESLLTSIRSSTIVVSEPIDGELIAKRFQKQVISSITPFMVAQRAIFQPVESISRHDAAILTNRGMKALRSYGSMCVVCLANGITYDCTLHDDRACSPVIWSQWVVYLCNDQHRSLFSTNVIKYIAQTPPHAAISSSCIVLGHALSGKTALAMRLSDELGLVYLELTQLVRTLAESNTQLARDVQNVLHTGVGLSDAMKVRIIHHAVNTSQSRIHGWVLDDFPETVAQAQLMRQHGIIPHHVFGISSPSSDVATVASVRARVADMVTNAQTEYEQIILAGDKPGSNGEVLSVFGSNGSGAMWLAGHSKRDVNDDLLLYHQRSDAIFGHYTRLYNNVRMLPHQRSPWHVSDAALSIMRDNRSSRQAHRALTLADRPGAIAHMNIPRGRRRASRSIYKDYCPVAWVIEGALRRSSLATPFTVLEFRGKYYWISSAAYVDMFNNDPIRFAGPAALAKGLPSFLPYHVNMQEATRIESRHCELLGHCSVSLKQAIDTGSVKEVFMGVPECTVSYKNRLYRFANHQQMSVFMQWPEVYWQIPLPVPLPKPLVDIPPLELLKMGNSLGFMEKSLSPLLNNALVSMDKLRLKYPGMPIGRSSLIYLALYLKAHRSSNEAHVTAKYLAKLRQFEHDCQLIPQLSLMHRNGNNVAVISSSINQPPVAHMVTSDIKETKLGSTLVTPSSNGHIVATIGTGSGTPSVSVSVSSSAASSSSYGDISSEYDRIRRLIDRSAIQPSATLEHLRSYFR